MLARARPAALILNKGLAADGAVTRLARPTQRRGIQDRTRIERLRAAQLAARADRNKPNKPDANRDQSRVQPDANRDKLRAAITALHEEHDRYTALTASQERAHAEQLTAQTAVAAAEADLQAVRRVAPGRLAYAYANNQALELGQAINEAQAALDYARGTLNHATEIEHALSAEIQASETRLNGRRIMLHQALADVVVALPGFTRLFDELPEAWARLRRTRVVIGEIARCLSGNMPEEFYRRWRVDEPLNGR